MRFEKSGKEMIFFVFLLILFDRLRECQLKLSQKCNYIKSDQLWNIQFALEYAIWEIRERDEFYCLFAHSIRSATGMSI